MPEIVIENTTSIEVEKVWSLLTDINSYPKYVKFVLTIKDPAEAFKEGIYWTDITDIVWIPLSIKHRIIKVEKNKKFAYEVFLPFGGTMMEEFELITCKEGTKIYSKIELTFKNYLLDLVFGPILKKRIRTMWQETYGNLEAISRS